MTKDLTSNSSNVKIQRDTTHSQPIKTHLVFRQQLVSVSNLIGQEACRRSQRSRQAVTICVVLRHIMIDPAFVLSRDIFVSGAKKDKIAYRIVSEMYVLIFMKSLRYHIMTGIGFSILSYRQFTLGQEECRKRS